MGLKGTINFKYFVGIDVGKNNLDFAVLSRQGIITQKQIPNNRTSIRDYLISLQQGNKCRPSYTVFCMEQNGIYCNHAISEIMRFKSNVVIDNPLQIRNSLGILRSKNDKIDAVRIAEYAILNERKLRIRSPRRPVIERLAQLSALRGQLQKILISLTSPLNEIAAFSAKQNARSLRVLCGESVSAVTKDLKNIKVEIQLLIDQDAPVSRYMHLMMSVPFVGIETAIQVLITTNEFKDINNAKKFACYAGVVPFVKQSGTYTSKAKVSAISSRKLKKLLHLCAIGSLRGKGELRMYYDRKVKEGKNKMAVLNAIRNKIVHRIFACINQDRLFESIVRAGPAF